MAFASVLCPGRCLAVELANPWDPPGAPEGKPTGSSRGDNDQILTKVLDKPDLRSEVKSKSKSKSRSKCRGTMIIEAALAAPRPAKVEATRGDVLIGGPICRYMFT